MRETRPKNSELPELAWRRQVARAYARVYLTRGLLLRRPCEDCGAGRAEMHHENYDKPLDVRWKCRPCHLEHHKLFNAEHKVEP